MSKLLQINSSLFGQQGQSTQLSQKFVEAYVANNNETEVTVRDLAENPVPHLDAEAIMGFGMADSERSEKQQQSAELSDALITEIKATDVLVLGLPMYNFSLPSTLKAYFDHIARAGITFKYTEKGPMGLLENKKAYVLAARGGIYAGTEHDTQTALVRHFLAFIGITDVEFIYAEGLNMGDEPKEQALNNAAEAIDKLVA